MKKVLFAIMVLLIGCGGTIVDVPPVDPPPVLDEEFDQRKCFYMDWKINGQELGGVIDTSYDVDPYNSGIQFHACVKFYKNNLPAEKVKMLGDAELYDTVKIGEKYCVFNIDIPKRQEKRKTFSLQAFIIDLCHQAGPLMEVIE
jgi:hypothetical protein